MSTEVDVNFALLATLVAYLILMVLVGMLAYRVTTNLSDYILGGRRLGAGTAALSAGASDMSGWLLLGLPGAVYAAGMNQIWIAVGLTIGAYLNWQFVADRLRRLTWAARDSITIPAYFENRFRDDTSALRVVSALVILVFFTFYTSAGLVAAGTLFEGTFDMDYRLALAVGAAVILVYTLLGGFLAVSWTDFIQGILMFLALILVPVITVMNLGGWTETTRMVGELEPGALDAFHDMTLFGIISLMAWGLGYFGQPHVLTRFMAIHNPRDIPLARFIGVTWMVVALFGAIFTGFAGMAFFGETGLDNPETVFILLIQTLFNPWVAGCLIAAVLAAIMSTIDSQLLVSSSALSEDFYKRFFRPQASDTELVWIGRGTVLGIGVLATLLALNPEAAVLDLVAYAWAGFGAAFGPVIILSVFWRGMNRNGALAGIVTGALTVLIWDRFEGGLFDMYEILPGFILASLAIILFSRVGKGPTEDMLREFDQVQAEMRRR
ncbi:MULTISPECIES: sodium/proline symporter PutP [Ectothiorhodospira]|jgi:sodium/proline symporter|uniref:Sodium/proline symporter n=1 Tax=Ectothiorhodospira marina TaxID=1396821 RepID=A0A1H7MQP8_9GAMM|nr:MULTISPECIES: sodium/proline symporter PutP [Ectothiorhodospira]SEL13562.1 sodium/proline symporter [Ectothiorhodospira marina]